MGKSKSEFYSPVKGLRGRSCLYPTHTLVSKSLTRGQNLAFISIDMLADSKLVYRAESIESEMIRLEVGIHL